MKKDKFFILKSTGMMIALLFLVSSGLFTSCEKEKAPEAAYFSIEGDPTGLTTGTATKTQAYVVRSNRPWKIVAQSEGDWVRAFPDEGDDDGIFKIIVDANATFDVRVMNYAFVVDGEEQPVLFRVEQAANVPFITLPASVTIQAIGGEVQIGVTSNVTWSYTLDDDTWLTEESVTSNMITFTAAVNNGLARSAVLTVTSVDFPAVSETVTLTQSPGSIVLDENFSWLSGSTTQVFYSTTDAKRYDVWTADQLAKGWTTTPNTFAGTPAQPLLYACIGYVKLGKTTYGGDLITPKLTGISGTKDVTVTFKAVPYMTATGTKDDNYLNISVIGPGTVSQPQFVIDNWPTYPAGDATVVGAYCEAFWNEPAATRTFTITGVTSDTQIKFLGGDYNLSGVGVGKNRIFLDDIKVEIIP